MYLDPYLAAVVAVMFVGGIVLLVRWKRRAASLEMDPSFCGRLGARYSSNARGKPWASVATLSALSTSMAAPSP